MMQSNYWDQVIRRRVTRRRALVASGGFGLGAAALALSACGGPLLRQAVRAGPQISKVKVSNPHFGEAQP